MSGISDVRLVLHSHELQAQHTGTQVKHSAVPEGFTRWQWYRHCQRTRRQLRTLTADELRDMGLSVEQARAEALKAFWQR